MSGGYQCVVQDITADLVVTAIDLSGSYRHIECDILHHILRTQSTGRGGFVMRTGPSFHLFQSCRQYLASCFIYSEKEHR
ncbi:hypothetical protein FKM82_021207 [Ascaphus truei]